MSKSRKELEHRQRRKYILDCAEKLFAEKGFDGVTVADIAKASEFSVGSLYLFFESKDELIKELLLGRVRWIVEIVASEVKKDIPAIEKLETTVDGLLAMFIERIDFFKLFIREVKNSEWANPHKAFGDEFTRIIDDFYGNLTSIFAQGIKEGTFKKNIEPLHMAFFLEACLHTLVEYMFHSGDSIPMDKIRRGIGEMFYHGILREGKIR
jgi:AcrR family transcriptional regulator